MGPTVWKFGYTSDLLVDLGGQFGFYGPPALYFIGLICSFFMLCFVGSVIWERLNISWWSGPTLALLFATGLISSSCYFVLRSLLCKLLPVLPGVPFFELPAAALVLIWGVRKRYWLHLTDCLRSPATYGYGALLIFGTAVFGWWYFLRPEPLSSDPGVLAGFLEVYRQQGQIPLQINENNIAIINYPAGFMVTVWPLLNPLLSSQAIVHLWPAISYTMAAAIVAEIFLFRAGWPARKCVFFIIGFFVFAKFCWMGEHFILSPFHEGVTKKSQTLPIVYGLALVSWLATRPKSEPLTKNLMVWLLLVAALMTPVFVNPVNFSVSAVLLTASAIWLMHIFWRRGDRRFLLLSVPIALAYVLTVLLQEPLLLSRIQYGSAFCAGPYDLLLAACRDPHVARWQTLSQLGQPPVNTALESLQDWQTLLPNIARLPFTLFYPNNLQQLATPWQLLWPLSGLAIALFWRKNLRASLRSLYIGAAVSTAVFVAFIALIHLQVWVFFNSGGAAVRRLIASYSDQSYLNLYTPMILFSVAAGGFTLLSRWSLDGAVSRDKSGQSKQKLAFTLALATTFSLGIHTNYQQIRKVRKRSGVANLGRLLEFHRTAAILRNFLEPQPETPSVVVPSGTLQINGEHWRFPDYWSYGLVLINGLDIYNGFSLSARPEPYEIFEHHDRLCHQFCQVAAEQRLTYFLATHVTDFCGLPVERWIQKNASCLPGGNGFDDQASPDKFLYRIAAHEAGVNR